jgi:prepilin-type N-terminal cleavage/methylation domain-containing protein
MKGTGSTIVTTVVQSGFTAIELAITLAILGIAVVAGIPAFDEARSRSEVRAASNELAATMRWARSEALRTNQRAVVTVAGAASCADGAPAAWSVLVATQIVRCGQAAEFSARYPNIANLTELTVTFNGRGVAAAAVSGYTVNTKASGMQRAISVETSGRVFEVSS